MITITLWALGGGEAVLLVDIVEVLVVGVGLQVECPRPHGLGLTFDDADGVCAGLIATPYTRLPTSASAAIQTARIRPRMPAPHVEGAHYRAFNRGFRG
jgi:hypothetical protein